MDRDEPDFAGDVQGTPVPAALFARYAQADLDRWRQVVGCRVEPVDARWGAGVVEGVTWGTCCEHVPAYVRIRLCYEVGWRVVACAETWQNHHRSIFVSDSVRSVIRECVEADLPDDEREACLARHSRALRAQHDRDALERAAQMTRNTPRAGDDP
jgi:hypothetical protein